MELEECCMADNKTDLWQRFLAADDAQMLLRAH